MTSLLSWIALVYLSVMFVSADNNQAIDMKLPDNCEACRLFSIEFESILNQSSGSHKLIQTGYTIGEDLPKRQIKYDHSEMLLIEALDSACEKMLEYKLHRDTNNSNRFRRGMTDTFKSLNKLVKKGVKVDIGIPYELWHTPTSEIVELKSKCFDLVEQYESTIEQWYLGRRDQPIMEYLCRETVLMKHQQSCLDDPIITSPRLHQDDDQDDS